MHNVTLDFESFNFRITWSENLRINSVFRLFYSTFKTKEMQVQNQAINPQMNVQPAQSQTRQPQQPQLQQTFASEIPVPSSEHSCYESMTSCLGACFGCLGSIPCLCCFQSPFYTVEQGTVGLITRFGKYYKSVDPGLYRLNLYTERM